MQGSPANAGRKRQLNPAQRAQRLARGKRASWIIALAGAAALIVWAFFSQRQPATAAAAAQPKSSETAAFGPSVPNKTPPSEPAPEGMVWIPGGEFSMGNADPRDFVCGGREEMRDARPIHRVYVDGFW